MIPKECKRLAEVDFPIAVVSKHSAREKSIRHGHPSTLHLWWARRPLAACRAMLLGLLLPDPCDKHCPTDFKEKARNLIPLVQGEVGSKNEDLRKALLKFIGDFANWDLSTDHTYLEVSRGLVKAAHPEETPLVVDPFAGGGSIPLEALRLGCETFASDLNPVACLILKVMLQDIPRNGATLGKELLKVGKEINKETKEELAKFYPRDQDGSKPIVYLWARTVQCETPNCGAEIPLVRSFWISKKTHRKKALKYKVIRENHQSPPKIEFEIFEPKQDDDVPKGTVNKANAVCPCCNIVMPASRVRAQLSAENGGADSARLLSVVTIHENKIGKQYRLPTTKDFDAILRARNLLKNADFKKISDNLNLVPDEPLPPKNTNCFRIPNYGMKKWGDLFTSRQKLAMRALIQKINSLRLNVNDDMSELIALALDRCADQMSSLVRWLQTIEAVASTFSRQALSMVWDFAEIVPFGKDGANFTSAIEWIQRVVETIFSLGLNPGQVQQADACFSPLPDETADIWFTDPPYYDAIGYAELSDFFYVWLKRTLPEHILLQDPYDSSNPLTPKTRECVQDECYLSPEGKPKDKSFFEDTVAKAFTEGRRILKDSGVASIVFAHKTTEGWEALLNGILRAGFLISASWPITTERGVRLRAKESAALSASIHLICRPRSEDAPIGDWAIVHRDLFKQVREWMQRLQNEKIRGADLVFACIGPALEIFSKYSKVVDPQERGIPLGGNPEASEPHKRGFLSYIWEMIGKIALEQVLGTAREEGVGTFEEDARLTALFLWTLQSTNGNGTSSPSPSPTRGEGTSGKSPTRGEENISAEDEDDTNEDEEAETSKRKQKGFNLIFDVVRRFAQPLGIHLPEWEGRIIETKKGIVRLLSVGERAKQLFGEDGAQAVADQLEKEPFGTAQLTLFVGTQEGVSPTIKGRRRKKDIGNPPNPPLEKGGEGGFRGATTLDRVHAAMLLQASGRANALRSLLKNEQERGPEFLRLANALSALYPKNCEEKRLLDAMLLAVPR